MQRTAVPPPTVPVPSSLQRLRTQATLDTQTGLNAGSLWVPQLSSKRPGTRDDGIRWDHDDIWQGAPAAAAAVRRDPAGGQRTGISMPTTSG